MTKFQNRGFYEIAERAVGKGIDHEGRLEEASLSPFDRNVGAIVHVFDSLQEGLTRKEVIKNGSNKV